MRSGEEVACYKNWQVGDLIKFQSPLMPGKHYLFLVLEKGKTVEARADKPIRYPVLFFIVNSQTCESHVGTMDWLQIYEEEYFLLSST